MKRKTKANEAQATKICEQFGNLWCIVGDALSPESSIKMWEKVPQASPRATLDGR